MAVDVAVSVLGPVRLEVDGLEVPVPGSKRQALLAMLAMASPEPVSVDRLVDAIWPDDPPITARSALQSHVSRLRGHLGRAASRLTSTATGYRLELEPHELDARVASSLVADARDCADEDPHRAFHLLQRALELWRGPALSGLDAHPPLAAWAKVLTESRLARSDLAVACALALGSRADALAIATEGVEHAPLREESVTMLMRALVADGRAAEALRAADAYRRRLRDETGLDATRALTEAEHAAASAGGGSREAGPAVPAPLDALVGRDAELAGVLRLLDTERLVTLLGPGGVGKTHLALTAAREASARNTVVVVRLAGLQDPTSVPTVLANTLGLIALTSDLVAQCADRLRAGPQLLVLDNCEHLRAAVAELAVRLLELCPSLTILATSRERLDIAAEQTCRVGPLPVPGDGDTDERSPSVALFLARARRTRPEWRATPADVATVGRIVRRLDGIPLGIELAAGRLSAMSLRDLEVRLDDALDLLSAGEGEIVTGAAGRHRTLRSALRWSYDLLPDAEQILFRHLAVFPDGFDLATAEVTARALDLPGHPARAVSHLVDASMLEAELGDTSRYRMLDTLRSFGLEELARSGESDVARERFVTWAVQLTEQLDAAPWNGAEEDADRRLRAELGNLRAAWHALRESGDIDRMARIVVNLYELVMWRDTVEVCAWARDLAADPALLDHPAAAQVLAVAAEGTWFTTGDHTGAEALALRALEHGHPDDHRATEVASVALGDARLMQGRFAEAEASFLRARIGRRVAEAHVLAAMAAAYGGEVDRAAQHLVRAAASPCPDTVRGFVRFMDGEVERLRGQWSDALAAFDEAQGIARRTGATFLGSIASVSIVSVHAASGRVDEALAGYSALMDYWERTGSWTQQWTTLRNLADLLDRVGDADTAQLIRTAAAAAPEAAGLGADGPPPTDARPTDRTAVLAAARAAIAARRPRR